MLGAGEYVLAAEPAHEQVRIKLELGERRDQLDRVARQAEVAKRRDLAIDQARGEQAWREGARHDLRVVLRGAGFELALADARAEREERPAGQRPHLVGRAGALDQERAGDLPR